MDLKTIFYEDWMKHQVINLICDQYHYNVEGYIKYFESFYENSVQSKSIKIVTLDDKTVVGFQSFFYWPYRRNNTTYKSYQSGNSIVHPGYRGKGIFQKMLNFISESSISNEIDFLIGFPVEASYSSFIRNEWDNPFNLNWHIKLNRFFSVILPVNLSKLSKLFNEDKLEISDYNNKLKLSESTNFLDWRRGYYKTKKYYFSFKKDNFVCQFGLKLNIRKKCIKEIIIGEINHNTDDSNFINEAFTALLKEIKKINFITIVSIATNSTNKLIIDVLNVKEFKPTERKIYFILKQYSNTGKNIEPNSFVLYRGDIDTW